MEVVLGLSGWGFAIPSISNDGRRRPVALAFIEVKGLIDTSSNGVVGAILAPTMGSIDVSEMGSAAIGVVTGDWSIMLPGSGPGRRFASGSMICELGAGVMSDRPAMVVLVGMRIRPSSKTRGVVNAAASPNPAWLFAWIKW